VNFNINGLIPAGPNDPADDQPIMQQNYANTKSYLAVDHIIPGAVGAGFHQKVTFNSAPNPIPSAPIDPISVEYTNVGVADNSKQQLYWRNENAIYPLSALKAFANFPTGNGAIVPYNSFNIASISGVGGVYTITIASKVIKSTIKPIILITPSVSFSTLSYTIVGNVLTITSTSLASQDINFAIIQI
jgi:hypothetical protein